jgi:S-adenosyl methyltransferase
MSRTGPDCHLFLRWERLHDGSAMSGNGKDAMEPGFAAAEIDTTKPHPARMYNAYLGGNDNYPADRAAVRQILRDFPEVRGIALANREFMQRAVRFLAAEAGIRQFLDIGTGIPSAGNVHEVAQRAAPDTRVVYVDNDPIVHVHANALLTGTGTTGIVLADLRDPAAILADPRVRELIDFTRPVALLLVAILHFIRDEEDPAAIVATLRDALPDGSYLVLTHGTQDFHPPGGADTAAAGYRNATAPLVLRTHEQVSAFFNGFDLLEPGLVQAPLWRPDGRPPRPRDLEKIGIYAGVGSKAPAGP